jgi:hypothetical protein
MSGTRPGFAFRSLVLRIWNLFGIWCFGFPTYALAVVGLGILLVGGCVTQPQRQKLPVCPGQPTVEAALRMLAARAEHAVPVRANGQGLLTYYVPSKKKTERHNLPLQMWFNPPADIYIQGSIAVDPRAVVLGSNDREFWLALRPKEMSSYYIGQWQDVQDFEGLMMSPRVVLEALGVVAEPAHEPNAALWSLQNKGAYDVLTRRDEMGHVAKRVYVYTCDYRVHKIEYFDRYGKVAAVANLGDYRPVTPEFSVPTRIAVESVAPDRQKDSLTIDLTSTRLMQFNEKQRERLFVPPDPEKFENTYRYEDGRWVRQ